VSARLVVPLALALALAGPPAAAEAAAPGRLGAQFRYWSFDDANDNRNPLVYWAPGPFHVQLEVWDFVRGTDQFRPELGAHLRDGRRSSYDLEWRHEHERERFTVGTGQVLPGHFVGRATLGVLAGRDSTDVVGSVGLDRYWGSWSFAGVDLIRDPRGDGLWTVPMRVRLATEANDWLQLLVAPASRRTLGWALDAKLSWVRLGIERNSRYDFSTRDNLIFTVGGEWVVPALGR
jgi:hypothetical protein